MIKTWERLVRENDELRTANALLADRVQMLYQHIEEMQEALAKRPVIDKSAKLNMKELAAEFGKASK